MILKNLRGDAYSTMWRITYWELAPWRNVGLKPHYRYSAHRGRRASNEDEEAGRGSRAFYSPVKILDFILVETGILWKILTEECQDEVHHSGRSAENEKEGVCVRGQLWPTVTKKKCSYSLKRIYFLKIFLPLVSVSPTKYIFLAHGLLEPSAWIKRKRMCRHWSKQPAK